MCRRVVVVVTRAEEQKATAIGLRLAVLPGPHGPGVGRRIPVGRSDMRVEPDVFVDAVLAGRLGQVFADVLAIRNGFWPVPRLERIAEREDVAVRPDAGVAEQVPGPADPLTSLQHRVGQVRILLVDPVCGADT